MNRKTFKIAGVTAALLVVLLVFASGCVSSGEEPETVTISGSTTVLPVAQTVAEIYMDEHANADIQISGGGSGVGVTAAKEGTADIGMLSRALKDSEKTGSSLSEFVIGRDGIALIAYPSNPVSDLSLDQIKDIYLGNITNWKEVGGSDMEIVLIGRDSASGTREFFTEYVLDNEDSAKTMQEYSSNGAVKTAVSQTPGAIGYVSIEYIDDSVKAFTISGVEATFENVISGVYEINRPLLLITNGEPEGLAKDFIEYILSDAGQKIIAENGFVPVA